MSRDSQDSLALASRPARAAVHATSGRRLGAAHPRQEGPTDLRLVPPALAAWATAALMLDAPPEWVAGVAVVCFVAAGVLLLVRRGGTGGESLRAPVLPRGAGGRSLRAPVRRGGSGRSGGQSLALPVRLTWPRTSAAALLLCVAAAAVSAALHGADLRRGPVPGLAREYATVTAEIEITSDPRLTRPRVKGTTWRRPLYWSTRTYDASRSRTAR